MAVARKAITFSATTEVKEMTGITVLTEASREFDSLVALPVLMGGHAFGEDRDYRLGKVKSLPLARATPPATRDRIWREIVRGTRSRGDIWKTVALGMALPGLANLAKSFAQDRRDKADGAAQAVCAAAPGPRPR
ncbi:hypothetical protein KGQ20_29785 [Catenulispora sp. NF23]|uniref:hypothetical protein n=1 Tax=Catenulispora pinistramenti TaxID=2705254 RepID=UPI001BAA4EB6|nr:hypothetical protein [Catenulispora pinistramenti]MBS2536961.1 hypothetical protein [Catenulispora pinistramenti]